MGYYVFPPIPFSLVLHGGRLLWAYPGCGGWFELGSAQFPGFRQRFDKIAPPLISGYAPPFLAALSEPGHLQIWSGLLAQTKQGWSALIRSPVNLPPQSGYCVFDGIVETDRWFGPLFGNIRLCLTGTPIHFDTNVPLFQVQPLPREAYSDTILRRYEVRSTETLSADDWAAYEDAVVKRSISPCGRGSYAAAVRKRRHAEQTEAVLSEDGPDGLK
jgi:hypothetical protein